jgi:CDP-diacylglycerol--glycerol-3-phosphate 3-phosphatidyltransferase
VIVIDCFDGYLARLHNEVTRLGAMMDMSLDGLGMLIGVLLLIQFGQVPALILLVGLARYLFLLGIWIRRRIGKPIYELPENPLRRQFAGAQMGFIGVILFPVFSPPGTYLAAMLFALPFFLGFL